MFTLPDKILDAIAGESWGLQKDFRQDELGDLGKLSNPDSDLFQKIILPRLIRNDEKFYRFFDFEETIDRELWKSSLSLRDFIEEAHFKFTNKLKELEKEIKEIDPALLGEKRSTKKWFLQRLIDIICAIFKRIFTSNFTINTLFCRRNGLRFRFDYFKIKFPFSLMTEIKKPDQILPKIQAIIRAGVSEEAEADEINHILEKMLPQIDLESFIYDKKTGNFTIRYSYPHQYHRDYQNPFDLTDVKMGRATSTIVCAKTVEGNIDTFKKRISFTEGISVQAVTFLDKKKLFLFIPLANAIEEQSQSQNPPALEFIEILKTGKIKAKGRIGISYIPDSKTFSYDAIKSFLSQISWSRSED